MAVKRSALAIANNDIVYLWWTYSEKIPDCLGFSVRRLQDGKDPVALPAFVGFERPDDAAPRKRARSTTDTWPVQSYQWKDLFVPEDTKVRYEIVPMRGTPGSKLEEIPGLAVRTKLTSATEQLGSHRIVFNRGIISTQGLSGDLPHGPSGTPVADALREHIGKPGDRIRKRLSGEALAALTSLLDRARKDGGRCFCALYELTDVELVKAIVKAKDRVELVLGNADSTKRVGGKDVKVYDGTNKQTREDLREVLGPALIDRLVKGNSIAHNKFVVYVDGGGTPRAVMTGSTNWTPTGMCAQSNNVLVLESRALAERYLEYYERLKVDVVDGKNGQAEPLRTADAQPLDPIKLGATKDGAATTWYSPNFPRKTGKPTDPPPPDMAELFQAITDAEHGVLFLLFSAGRPSVLQHITKVSQDRAAANKRFFVRGAISDEKTAQEYETRVYNDSLLDKPNVLISGIGAVPDRFAFWEQELAKLGHAVIHDKLVVVDPFTDNCLVAAGSHNLGYKASRANDENLLLIRGNRKVAEAYAAHVLDIVNHYNWRRKLNEEARKAKATGQPIEHAFDHLAKSDGWQDKYFEGSFLRSRDLFFFPPA
jgi:phosphatidylserine/phosphatidylglycerophosphate/cardiolipin synthase-like enzyme